MEEYISDNEFKTLIEDLLEKMDSGDVNECHQMLLALIQDSNNNGKYIDRTYLGSIKEKKRLSRIKEIDVMLSKMTNDQVDNVHRYTMNEYDEPNHEAEALEAIVRLSRKKE